MLDKLDEITTLYRCLSNDAILLELLGLPPNPTPEEKKRVIQWSMQPSGLASGRRVLCYYSVPDIKGRNYLVSRQMYEFDAHVPKGEMHISWQIVTRVHELIHEQRLGKYIFEYYGELGELPTAEGYYAYGRRFYCDCLI